MSKAKGQDILQTAMALAVKAHAGQARKYRLWGSRLPYVVHPVETMKTVWRWGVGNPLILAAAVLHDVLEDSKVTPRLLRRKFGDEVADMVVALTHDPKQMRDKAEYLRTFAEASPGVLVVKLADRHNNISDCLATDPARSRSYFARTLPLVQILRDRRAEVSEQFGEDVARAILRAYDELRRAIARVY